MIHSNSPPRIIQKRLAPIVWAEPFCNNISEGSVSTVLQSQCSVMLCAMGGVQVTLCAMRRV